MFVVSAADSSAECDDGVLDEAVEWTNQVDGRLLTLQHELTAAGWNYVTNLTDYNAQQVRQRIMSAIILINVIFDDEFPSPIWAGTLHNIAYITLVYTCLIKVVKVRYPNLPLY